MAVVLPAARRGPSADGVGGVRCCGGFALFQVGVGLCNVYGRWGMFVLAVVWRVEPSKSVIVRRGDFVRSDCVISAVLCYCDAVGGSSFRLVFCVA